MKNIEVKIYVDNFRGIISKLKNIGAEYGGKLYQIDTYYNCKLNRLKMREINKQKTELICYSRLNKENAKISNYDILEVPENLKQKTREILKKAFGEKVVVKKERNLWIYRNTRIHLDKVFKLGDFLELETVVKKNMEKSKKEYEEVFSFLNLNKYKKYKKSYSDMLMEKT